MAQGLTKNIPISTNLNDASNSDALVWSQKAVNSLLGLKQGSPTIVDYSATSTLVGWSSTTIKTIIITKYPQLNYDLVYFQISGTSNSGLANFTIDAILPSTSKKCIGSNLVLNNNATQDALGVSTINPNSNVVNAFRGNLTTAYTASGTKTVEGIIIVNRN